ncbi:MAG: cbb3-type cytochrome c oxidase subunit II [Bacteroidales bacterium]
MNFLHNHNYVFTTAVVFFAGLTVLVAILPAINNQKNNATLSGAVPLSEAEFAGKQSFIANGCVACHTQQVRNVDMDRVWGKRPGIAADYAGIKRTDFWRNTATLMGTERTGPDLTDIGTRQPSMAWNLLHLYQPRAVVENSIMPAYPWLFEVKEEIGQDEIEVVVPEKFRGNIKGKIVAKQEALNLVSYLQSLKQVPLPGELPAEKFLYEKDEASVGQKNENEVLPDGKSLYTNNCMACHQANGQGLKGAFPPMVKSPVVLDDDPELMVNIIMKGYDARPEYAVMNAVGKDNNLTPEEVTAIINYVKTNWGNNAKTVSAGQVKKIIEDIK